MPGQDLFHWVCEALLERANHAAMSSDSATSRELAVRATLRWALKTSGLDDKTVSRDEMVFVVREVLPEQLEGRGETKLGELCSEVAEALSASKDVGTGKGRDDHFGGFLKRLD